MSCKDKTGNNIHGFLRLVLGEFLAEKIQENGRVLSQFEIRFRSKRMGKSFEKYLEREPGICNLLSSKDDFSFDVIYVSELSSFSVQQNFSFINIGHHLSMID